MRRFVVNLGYVCAGVVESILIGHRVYAVLPEYAFIREGFQCIYNGFLNQEYRLVRPGFDYGQECTGVLTDGEALLM